MVELQHVGVGPAAVFEAVNSTFTSNAAVARGGVVYADSSVLDTGGAMQAVGHGCVVNITSSTLQANAALGGGINDGVGNGGALSLGALTTTTLIDTDLIGNSAVAGGAVEAFGRAACVLFVRGGLASHNTARDGGAFVMSGGAVLYASRIVARSNRGTRYGVVSACDAILPYAHRSICTCDPVHV